MNTSILICGGEQDNRVEKALELANSISTTEDVLFFNAASERGIQSIRVLLPKLAKKPYHGKVMTAIISEAQNLTIEAQNALLKNLEEPNTTSQIILTATSSLSLLSTVSSRCRIIYLHYSQTKETGLPRTILSAEVSERLDYCEKLDIEDWVKYLRQILKKSIFDGKASSKRLIKLVKYLRFVERINANKVLANPKLAKYLTIISIPNDLK